MELIHQDRTFLHPKHKDDDCPNEFHDNDKHRYHGVHEDEPDSFPSNGPKGQTRIENSKHFCYHNHVHAIPICVPIDLPNPLLKIQIEPGIVENLQL